MASEQRVYDPDRDRTPLDEIPGLLRDWERWVARITELDAAIDQAGERAAPDLAESRRQAKRSLAIVQARVENSDWPPTAPLQ